MKLNEKIRLKRKELGLTLQDLYDLQVQEFGPAEAISYRTLVRIENGESFKFSNIVKICQSLGLTLTELLDDTELADNMIIRGNNRIDSYTYNDKAIAEVITSPSMSFLATEVILDPGGATITEQCPNDQKYQKLIYILEGALTCIINNDQFLTKRKDSLSINASLPHKFTNTTKKRCKFLVFQDPKYF